MAVSKLPSNAVQREPDESSDVSDTGWECFTCGWLWSAHKFSQDVCSCQPDHRFMSVSALTLLSAWKKSCWFSWFRRIKGAVPRH